MWTLEAVCVLIVAAYFVAHRADPALRRDALWVALAAWLGEDTMIRAYHFYAYAPGWHLRVDHVPVLIPAIWAPVVLSARAVARALRPGASVRGEAVLVGALVTFDAALIEPIAVRAGLWRWFEPGIFSVPLAGILGWGLFAGAAVALLRGIPRRVTAAVVPLSVLAAHALVLASWWLALRWVLRTELAWTRVAPAVALASLAFTVAVVRTGASLPWRELLPRAAATGFFAALLVPRLDLPPGVWALLFTPPWLALCARALRRPRG